MRVGDLAFVGNMGQKCSFKGYPVLILRIDKQHKTCYGLVDGNIKWFRWLDLRYTP